jgi:uncharacterized protein (DUF2147 family)
MLRSPLMFKLLVLFFLQAVTTAADDTQKANLICGKWISEKKDFLVLVYRDGNTFKGKTLWFKNKDASKSMEEWTDKHNPDPALRNRKLVGINILTELVYNSESNTWENGKIYDASGGKFWSTYVKINKDGTLKVTAFWTFKFISKSVIFTRYNNERLAN